jgi:crotonobetainyl-CoA:carnitine CoA-transferase CaiB-like acyl-CoA transferase
MLVDMGAEVVKIEPPDGDLTRFSAPRINSLATYFIQQNAGKRCISIDLATEEGAGILRGLVSVSDVLIENYRAGVMDRLGLGWTELSALNPRLIHASITGYGSTGPWTDRRAYASVVGAESGFTRMQGDVRGGDYANDPWSHADTYTAIQTAAAILAALYQREHTGRGEHIDISMAETMLYVDEHVHNELYDGPVDPQWIRSFQTGDYPVVRVADGSMAVICGHPAERGTFELICRAMDRPELVDDPRFVDTKSRKDHFNELVGMVLDWAATVSDVDDLERRCAANSIAVGALRSVREIAESDWAHARGAIVEVDDRGGGKVRIPNAPWHFAHGIVGTAGQPRYRGEDNRAVLRELLGLDDSAIDRLERNGVISSRVPGS